MTNPYLNYYKTQSGTGLSHFAGIRYQRGYGIASLLSGLFRNAVLPALSSSAKYLGKQALNTVGEIGRDIIEGQNVMSSIESRAKNVGNKIVDNIETGQRGCGPTKRRAPPRKNYARRGIIPVVWPPPKKRSRKAYKGKRKTRRRARKPTKVCFRTVI